MSQETLFGQIIKHESEGKVIVTKKSRLDLFKKKKSISGFKVRENPFREAEIMEYLKDSDEEGHQYIIKYYGSKIDDIHHYIMMEAAEIDLYNYQDKNTLTYKQIKSLFKQLILGLYFLDRNDVCHLDISMENLLLTSKGELRICDFGLARYKIDCEDITRCGKSNYMSPEFYFEEPFDGHKTDIFAAGVILFNLLTKRSFWSSPSKKHLFYRRIYLQGRVEEIFEKMKVKASSKCLDLLKHILCPEENRYTALDTLNSPWLKK